MRLLEQLVELMAVLVRRDTGAREASATSVRRRSNGECRALCVVARAEPPGRLSRDGAPVCGSTPVCGIESAAERQDRAGRKMGGDQ
jgi:hypothetical protein